MIKRIITLKTNDMSTKTETTAKKPVTNGNGTLSKEKAKTNYVKRTDVDLKKTEKGKITLIVQSSAILANKNERKEADGLAIALTAEKNTEKGLRQSIYKTTKAGKGIDTMDAKSPEYAKLIELARVAKADLMQSSYTKNVVALLNYCITNIGGSTKGFNPSVLADIEL